MFNLLPKLLASFVSVLFLAFASPVFAATIYFADNSGNVGAYDDVTTTVTPVGNLGAFTINQVMGIAYDPANDRILILDRGATAVYEMDPATGIAALLFTPSQEFQGGAVKGNTLYGIDEATQTVVAYDLTTFAPVVLAGATPIPGHSHGMGINPATGQLVVENGTDVLVINDDGSIGASLVAAGTLDGDIDSYGSDFLNVEYGSTVDLIDGTTGAATVFLTSVQITSAGVTGSVSGIVVASAALPASQAIPTLSQWGMILLVMSLLVAAYTRRKLIL